MPAPASLSIQLDRDSAIPLVEQLATSIRHGIESGVLVPGTRLPSTRTLAARLGLHRQTIVDAYRRIESDGMLEQRRGSGAFITAPSPGGACVPGDAARAGERVSQALLSYERRAGRPPLPASSRDALDLAGLVPHERDYPSEAFQESMRSALARRGGKVLGYGPAAGDPELREVLAKRLRARGMKVDAAGLLIVGGAQQGLDLLFRAMLDPGDAVLTEAPTYHMCLDLLAFHRCRVAPVPVLPREESGLSSLDAAALAEALDRHRPVLAYVMPTFQNPTGLTLDLAARRTLARTLADAKVVLVEDDYEADMRHGGEALPAVSSLSESGDSAYIGTLSKALFPGLRVGWIAGSPDVLARVAKVKRVSDLSGPVVLQAVAADLLESGAYDRHVTNTVAEAADRMRALRAALEAQMPEGCRITRPLGGHVAWLEAPALSGRAIAEKAAARGVLVTPGEDFFAGPAASPAVRVSIARIAPGDVERAAERLARGVADAVQEARGRAARRGRDVDSPVAV